MLSFYIYIFKKIKLNSTLYQKINIKNKMKTLILCLSVFAVAFNPSNAFLSGIIDSVTSSLNNAVDSISSTINTVVLAGEFLWDNALQPSLQVLQESNFKKNLFKLVIFTQIFFKTEPTLLIIILEISSMLLVKEVST